MKKAIILALTLSLSFLFATNVTFQLDMSNEDVSVDGVHIAGGMQGWDPAASELTDADADGIYEITFDLTAGDTVQYTFLNGNSWGGQEDNTGLAECGVDNGWGAYNRVYIVGEADETVGPVCFSSCITCDQVYVTFQVDMQNEEVSAEGVHIAGSMQGWDPSASAMTDEDADGVYEATFALTTGETAYYKYVNGNAWGSEEIVPSDCADGGNRFYVVGEMDETLPVVCFSGCSTCEPPNIVTAVVTFQADMTNFVGFDPSVHTLEVRGSFNGWGGGDALQADLVDPNLYVLDVEITENVGNEVFWKFKANPDEDWNNTGWETGDNKVFDWTGEAIILEALQPDILPAGAPLTNDVTFTFAVQWVDGVLNVNSGEPFVQKPEVIVFNGSYLNGWYTWGDCIGDGCETPASTDMPHLTDDDGDNIFTGTLSLPAGHDNLFMAKFGGWYSGIEIDAPGTNGAIDNEAGFGQDRVILIPVDATEFAYETIFGINNPDNEFPEDPVGVLVTFQLDMSNEDVSVDGVHIAGGMQGWDPAASELTDADADGIYEITFDLTAGDTVQYTFLNGNSWGGQEDNTGLAECGVDNGWGAYNRVYIVGEADETVGPVCFSSCITCDQVYVTFQVDMQNEEVSAEGVHIAGSMQGWDPSASAMTDEDADGVYEATFALTTGETAYYKYVNGNAWGSEEIVPSDCADGGNRFYVVGEMDETLPVVCFSGCSTCEPPNIVTAVVTFQADMTNFVGFDPSVHTLEVRGSFNGWGGGDALQADLVDPNLYVLDVEITENVGNEVFWKFKANPDEDWNNTGWETGDNKVFDWTGEAIILEALQPDILPAGAPLTNDVTFTFAVQWVDGVLNVNSGEPFVQKPEVIVFNGSYLNGWYTWGDCIGDGCETPASTDMPHLTDDDGDNIFTGTLSLPAGHDNLFMAKFGGWYSGIEIDAPGTNGAIDNEAGFGQDRVILIPVDATEFAYETIFGINNPDNELSVVNLEMIPDEFALKGNFPNPFNPETSIMFDLDITSNVTVKIYSLLGEEVITLYNGQADPGVYSIKWNATNSMGREVPSGVYLYSVISDKRMHTGKMLLLK